MKGQEETTRLAINRRPLYTIPNTHNMVHVATNCFDNLEMSEYASFDDA
jgi:hypothetical protein